MLPLLVQIFSNEESTNIIPVPWMLASSRPVSRNRSSSVRTPAGTFQQGWPVTIEVIILDPVHERYADAALPLAKIHIPSRINFIGYTQLLGLHPVIPTAAQLYCKMTTEGGNLKLYATSKMKDEVLDLGDRVSASVIKYDPSNDEELEFYVEVLDGSHAGQKGWMIDAFSCDGEDGMLISQFSNAVVLPRTSH
jgi:hypothetical protein